MEYTPFLAIVASATAIAVAIILKPRKVMTASESPNFCGCKSCTLADSCSHFIGKQPANPKALIK